MSLTDFSEPQPSLAWQFESSNVDSVTSLQPSAQVSPGPAQLQGGATLVTTVAGVSNTAVYFPGTAGSYMNLGTSSPTEFNIGSSNLFIETWMYINSVPTDYTPIIANGPTGLGSSQENWGLQFVAFTATPAFFSNNKSVASSITPSLGTWVHISASYNTLTSTAYIFVNGEAAGSVSGVITRFRTGITVIGIYPQLYTSQYSNMYIRDLRVVQGGVVPVATFTPLASAPFSYASPGYVPNMGTTVFTLLGQFVTYVPGKFGSAIKLTNPVNANTEYISYPIPTIRIEEAGFSCACWVNFQALPPNNYQGYFLNFYGSTSTGLALNLPTIYALLDYATSKIVLVYYVANDTFMIPTDYVVSLNTWYHFAFTIYGGYVRMYINGTQTTNPRTYDATTYANLNINTRFNLGNSVLGGYSVSFTIDDLRVYQSALTAAQVRSIYTQSGAPASNFRVMPQPRLAWDFNGTTTDYVTGLVPTSIGGSPTYVAGKYIQGLNFPNSINTGTSNPTNNVVYTVSLNATIGFTFAFWVNFNVGGIFAQQILSLANAAGSRVFWTYLNNSNRLICGGAPGDLAFPTITLSTGIWYHIALVVVGGNRTAYINGQSTTSATTFTGTAEKFSIGGDVWLSNFSAWCSYDDLRVYNSALSSSQIQTIYNQQGVPGRGVASNDAYITSGLVAYYDTQNLRYPNSVSGTTWYDISGNGRSVTIRPGSSYNSSGKYITFDGTVNSGTTVAQSGQSLTRWTVMCAFMQTANGTSFARVAGSSPAYDAGEIALYGQALAFNPPENSAWTTTSFTTTYNVWYHMCVAFDTTTTGVVDAWVYINGALVNSYTIDGTVESLTGYTIGARNDFNNEAMIGRMSLFAIYNRVLSPSEVSANYEFYKKTQIPTYLPVQLTGAPLFNQLSQSAASSAVGAFSLRAVNGVTAKAVQVRAVPSGASSPSVFSIIGNQFSAPDQSPTPPDTSVSGQTSYNGTNQYTRINPLALTPGTTGLTISMAFKLNSRNNTLFKLNAPYPSLTIEFASTSSNISVIEYLPAAGTQVWFCNVAYTTSTNVYISLVISGTTAKTFVNNTLFNTSTLRSAMSNATNYDLYGVGSWNGGGYANMTLYDLRIQNTIIPDSSFAAQDFYADERGNLLTAPVVGTTLQNWLGGATGYVTKWYDQSGTNHAIQDTAANQPIIQKATKGPGYMVNFNGTSQFVTLSASYNFLNGTNITVNAVALRTATVTLPNYIIGTNSPTASYQRFFLGFNSDTSFAMPVTGNPPAVTIPAYNASSEPVTYMTGGLTPSRVLYKNDTLGGTDVDTTLLSVPPGYSYSIGYTVGAATYYYRGNLFELLIFTSALNQAQVTQVYQNQLSAYGT